MTSCDFSQENAHELRRLIEAALEKSPYTLGLSHAWPESRWQWLAKTGVWLKREDELGFPGTGPKQRKLLSLALTLMGQSQVISAGSSRSVFLLSLSALCKNLALPLELHLIRATPWLDQGVDGLYRGLLETETIHWHAREDFPSVLESLAQNPCFIPEGGSSVGSLAGALSLSVEILEQAGRLSLDLRSIWIDAGSGFSAQALILGLGFMGWQGQVTVLLCAGDELSFEAGLRQRQAEAARLWPGLDFPAARWTAIRPSTARSYGSTNRQVWTELNRVLQTEGVLLDPIYNAKLFLTWKAQANESGERTVLIHSGGSLTSFAYPEAFALSKI
jgi:1-aminocyclopropane-1-carboxylate deaminase